MKLRPDPLKQRLGRIRRAVIYGTVAWESFADLYGQQGSMARGLGAGLAAMLISLAALAGSLALLRWWYSWYLDRRRPFETAEQAAAFRGLLEGVLAYLCLLALVDDARWALPPAAWDLPVHLRYPLALAGAACLSVGPLAGRADRRAWAKAWALGALVFGLILMFQRLLGVPFHPDAWDVPVWLLLPLALQWAFPAGAWPLACRAFGRTAGTLLSLALFAQWVVQPARWSDAGPVAAAALIGAVGLYLTHRARPGIR